MRSEVPGGPAYFPLFMNLERKRFLVIGGGQIAARRIGTLLRFGACVVVIAPQVNEKIWELQAQYPEQLTISQRSYCAGEIRKGQVDYVLAAANDPLVNEAAAMECRSKAIPVNHAGDRSQCDFYFPALVEDESLVIGLIGTDGDHKKTADIAAMLRRFIRNCE